MHREIVNRLHSETTSFPTVFFHQTRSRYYFPALSSLSEAAALDLRGSIERRD